MSDRRLIITVSGEEYRLLAKQARQNVRSPEQQAAYIVRHLIADGPDARSDDPWPASTAAPSQPAEVAS